MRFSNSAIPDINHYSIHIIQTISKSYHLRCGKNIYNNITNSKRYSWSILAIVLLSIVIEVSEVSFTYSLIDDQIKPWYLRTLYSVRGSSLPVTKIFHCLLHKNHTRVHLLQDSLLEARESVREPKTDSKRIKLDKSSNLLPNQTTSI